MSALLHAEHLGLSTKAGPVFSDVSFSLPAGTLSVVLGPSGSGRSALLLAVTGRMKGVTGSVRLGGRGQRTRPADLRRRTTLARSASLVGLEDKLTVAESVTERALIDGVPPVQARRALAATEQTLGTTFPRSRLVEELGAYQQALLCVALAGLRPADLVVLDDADRGLDVADQSRLFEALQRLCGTGCTILAATTEALAVPAGVVVISLAPSPAAISAGATDQASADPAAPADPAAETAPAARTAPGAHADAGAPVGSAAPQPRPATVGAPPTRAADPSSDPVPPGAPPRTTTPAHDDEKTS